MMRKNSLLTILLLMSMTLSSFHWICSQPLTIMLDPTGDAEYTGRKIDNTFERGITLQFAEQLKKIIEEKYPTIRVVLTRFPGETLQPLQNANFANRLDVHLYISFHFYEEQATIPNMFLYYFSSDNNLITKPINLAFYPYDKAHLISHSITKNIADTVASLFIDDRYQHQFIFKGPFSVPFSPLIGIKSPAIAFEIGLKTNATWRHFLKPITDCLETILQKKFIS